MLMKREPTHTGGVNNTNNDVQEKAENALNYKDVVAIYTISIICLKNLICLWFGFVIPPLAPPRSSRKRSRMRSSQNDLPVHCLRH